MHWVDKSDPQSQSFFSEQFRPTVAPHLSCVRKCARPALGTEEYPRAAGSSRLVNPPLSMRGMRCALLWTSATKSHRQAQGCLELQKVRTEEARTLSCSFSSPQLR